MQNVILSLTAVDQKDENFEKFRNCISTICLSQVMNIKFKDRTIVRKQ